MYIQSTHQVGIRFGGVREQLPQLSQMDLFIDVAGGAKRGVTRYVLPLLIDVVTGGLLTDVSDSCYLLPPIAT